jgi:Fur family peroxide stress response transcriptional regulator
MDKPGREKPSGEKDSFEEKFRQNNLKLTPQRSAVYAELVKSEDHPSADTIFRRLRNLFPGISLDTVSRTLLTFHKIGLANIVEGSGVPKRFDANIEQHHHFRCLHCNLIIDIYDESFDAIAVPEEIHRQCMVTNKAVHLEGLCGACRTGH